MAIDMDGAGAALADAAAVLSAMQIQDVAQNPEKRSIASDVKRGRPVIDGQCNGHSRKHCNCNVKIYATGATER